MALTLTGDISGDLVVFRCRGRIVVGDEGAMFRERIRSMFTAVTPKIVIDLCDVDYMDSGGVGILVGLWMSVRNRGGDIKLVAPSKRVLEVLDHTKLNTVLPIYDTYDEALAAFSKHVA